MKLRQNRLCSLKILFIFFTLCLTAITLSSCEKEEIKVGFSGCLTGRLSDMGIAGRDGALLAVSQLNEQGGIGGRKVRLIVKDDKQEAATAITVDQELIDEGVVAIIGHMTSSMSLAVLELINREKIVMISPTSTSNQLTGLDDYFIRTALPDRIQIKQTANLAINKLNLGKIAILHDISNKAFTEGWRTTFSELFTDLGGVVVFQQSFTSGKDVGFKEIAESVIDSEAQGVVLIAGALDTALFSQHLRLQNDKLPLIATGWAKTPELIKHGGNSVEGLMLPQTHDSQNQNPRYLKFIKDFQENFGYEPNFAATGAFDAANLLFEAIGKAENQTDIKKAILSLKKFAGTQSVIEIDRFGDANRETFMMSVQNQTFVTLEI